MRGVKGVMRKHLLEPSRPECTRSHMQDRGDRVDAPVHLLPAHGASLAYRCLVKWLEVRCVCPMCNKPIAGPSEASQSIGILLDELV